MSKVEVKTLVSVVLKTNIGLPERILYKYQGLVTFLCIYSFYDYESAFSFDIS